MKKLIILQGPPASGKSTWTKKFMEENSSTSFVVSRDAIRHSMGDYNHLHEDEVTRIEEAQTKEQMKIGTLNIINDGTNLNPKHLPRWEKMAKKYGYEIEYKQFHVSIEEAIKRDQNEDREHHVGKSVIKRFYKMYFPEEYKDYTTLTINPYRVPINDKLPKCVICDIDGTVAWMQGRSPYDWKRVGEDKYDERMFQVLNSFLRADVDIIFISGREGTTQCYNDTLEWIKKKLVGYDKFKLYLPKEKDYRGGVVTKKELYEKYVKDYYDVICVFEDSEKMANIWRSIGLLCCQVSNSDNNEKKQ